MAVLIAGVVTGVAALAVWKRSLVAAEWLKITRHPFLYVALSILILGIPLWAELKLKFVDYRIGKYRELNAFLMFALGAEFGIQIAALVVVIFSALSFAGEFDKGTIKVLLTQPVTRTEVFAAKVAAMMLLALALTALTVYESLVWGLVRGDLGHVWQQDVHQVFSRLDVMMGHAATAIGVGVFSMLATCLLGIFISSLTESSGHAVAAALTVFFVMSIALFVLRDDRKLYLFNHYPGYGIGILIELSRASAGKTWNPEVLDRALYAQVPAVTAAALAAVAWLRLRFKDITA
jgi:hypothetical protein